MRSGTGSPRGVCVPGRITASRVVNMCPDSSFVARFASGTCARGANILPCTAVGPSSSQSVGVNAWPRSVLKIRYATRCHRTSEVPDETRRTKSNSYPAPVCDTTPQDQGRGLNALVRAVGINAARRKAVETSTLGPFFCSRQTRKHAVFVLGSSNIKIHPWTAVESREGRNNSHTPSPVPESLPRR